MQEFSKVVGKWHSSQFYYMDMLFKLLSTHQMWLCQQF